MNLKNHSLHSRWPVFLFFCYVIYWISSYIFLNENFSKGGFDDWYQNTGVIAAQKSFLAFRWPLLGDFPPFDAGWGTHWPFYMILKSAVFSILPYSETAMLSFSMVVSAICSGWVMYAIASRTGNRWLGALGGSVVLSDRVMHFHLVAARGEPLVSALLLMVVYHSRAIAAGTARSSSRIGYLLPFFLLPTLHPFGITVTGGLAVLHLLLHKRLFPRESGRMRWLPMGLYLAGLISLCLWFACQPSAWEQMRLNLTVQNTIYESSTRYTYFLKLMPSYPGPLGYAFWGGGLILALWVALAFARSLWFRQSDPPTSIPADSMLASAVVVSLPLLGLLLQIDNYFHYVTGAACLAYLWCVTIRNCDQGAGKWIVVCGLGSFAGVASLGPAYRLLKYERSGSPRLGCERNGIVAEYQSARRLYVPLCLYEEAMRRCPERARFFQFPVPMPESVRRSYENYAYGDTEPGDILIVNRLEVPENDHYLNMPTRSFTPPDETQWEFLARHFYEVPSFGGRSYGWDLFVYRRKEG